MSNDAVAALVSRPMSATSISPASSLPGGSSKPGLQGGERDGALRPQHALGSLPVRPSTPLGMSTASTGGRGLGRDAVTAEPRAECCVDHEVRARQHHRGTVRVDLDDPHPPPPQTASSVATVVAVVALAGEHDDPPTVGATEHLDRGPRHRGPARPMSTSTGSGGRGSIAAISTGVTMGIIRCR